MIPIVVGVLGTVSKGLEKIIVKSFPFYLLQNYIKYILIIKCFLIYFLCKILSKAIL